MQSQMTRLTFGGRWSGLTTPGQRGDGAAGAPARSEGLSSDASASDPTPDAPRPRKARRVRLAGMKPGAPMVGFGPLSPAYKQGRGGNASRQNLLHHIPVP